MPCLARVSIGCVLTAGTEGARVRVRGGGGGGGGGGGVEAETEAGDSEDGEVPATGKLGAREDVRELGAGVVAHVGKLGARVDEEPCMLVSGEACVMGWAGASTTGKGSGSSKKSRDSAGWAGCMVANGNEFSSKIT